MQKGGQRGVQTVLGVVQARTGSSRLPGKVLEPLGPEGRSALGWLVRAAQASEALDDLVVATTTQPSDDALVKECADLGVECVRGPVDDVLSRFLAVPQLATADAVVRFTADCPLLDPALVASVVGAWRGSPWLDYVSTAMPRSVPRGLDVEIVRGDVLRALDATATGHDRTHVTSAVYSAPDRYRMLGLRFQPDTSDLRVTVDTADDLVLVRALVAELGDRPPAMHEVVDLLRADPELVAMNAHIVQKTLDAG